MLSTYHNFCGGEIFVVLAVEVRPQMLRQTRIMDSPTVIQA